MIALWHDQVTRFDLTKRWVELIGQYVELLPALVAAAQPPAPTTPPLRPKSSFSELAARLREMVGIRPPQFDPKSRPAVASTLVATHRNPHGHVGPVGSSDD